MAKILSNAGIVTGLPVEAEHVSQSVNALTAAEAYDINISGSLIVNNLKYPIVDGVAGQSLLTDGVGNITIQSIETVDTASYVTSSNVYGPFGADSIQTASYAPSSSLADFAKLASSSFFALQTLNAQTATSASYALTASYLELTDSKVIWNCDKAINTCSPVITKLLCIVCNHSFICNNIIT